MSQGIEGIQLKHDKGYLSEELHKTLFEQAADGIFIITEKGLVEVNSRGCEMLGYTQAEIRNKTVTDLFPDENVQALFRNQSAIEAGHTKIHEGQLLRKDGSSLPVEINGRKLKDGRLIGIVRDISERKQAKEEILRLARFPAENPNPILRVSREGKILYANDASEALLKEWNTGVGGLLPSAWKKTTSRLAEKRSDQNVEIPCKGRVYSMTISPVPGTDYVNLYGSDITEIKRSGEALRRAEEKYRNIFEYSQDGIFQSTPAGRFITVNPSLARIWGYETPEEVIKSITNIAHQIYVNPEQRAEFMRVMNENDEVENFEFQAYRKDGGVIWVQENVRTVRDTNGSVKYYEGTVKDITEQKHMLEALRRSEERYRNTLNNMIEGCQIIDFDWRYIYVNDTAALHGRRKPEEMLMRTMMELYPGIEQTDMFAVFQRCMEYRTPERIENEFTFPDGEKGWFELGIQPVPEGLFILSLDISERKKAEMDLRDREARYRTLFESLPIPVFTKDIEGRYTSFNAKESKYWAESPIGRTDHELLPPEIADGLRATDLQVMESGKSWSGEEVFQSPQGIQYSLSRKVPLHDGDGNVIGVLGASVDITQRKQAEEKLREAEQFNQSTLDALTAHICVLDKNGVILSVNNAWDEFAESNPPVPPHHFIGENYLAVCDAAQGENSDDAGPFAAGLRTVIQGERAQFSLEYPCDVPDGEKRWFVARVTRFSIGEATRVVVAHENITARKQALLALEESEERFRSLYENAAIGIYRTTPQGQILMVNPAAIRMLGYKNFDELAQRNLEQGGYESTYPRNEFHQLMEKENVITGLEKAWIRKDGSTIYVRESARAIRDENGKVKYYDGTFEDITEQKLAEEELRASEERFRDLVENSQELICTHDLEGNILSVNPWAAKTLGYEQEKLIKMNIADFLLSDNRAHFQKYLAEIQKNGRAQGLLTVQTSTGEQLIWEYNNSLRLEGVEKPVVRGMAHDVTEQRKAENKIKQQLERLTALREIDRLITTSFDLNQTLSQLVAEVTQQLSVDAATILLVKSDTNTLEFIAGTGFHSDKNRELRLKIGEDYAGKIVLERKMIHIPDIAKAEPKFSQAHLSKDEKFVAYYGLPLISKGQINGVLEIFHRSSLDPDEESLSYLETLAGQAAIAIDNARLFENLQQTNTELTLAYDATIEGWSYALDLRDKETEGHTQRVTEITYKLCEKFGMSESELTYVRWGALLHDIGKMGIPDSILLKPGKLSEDEWVIMKMHPVFARKMLERVNYLKSAIDIPYYHHEKWDGSGYPEGLKGEQIPLTARIFAVADVWDALTSDRPYRPAWSKKDTLKYIESAAGTHLDPQVVEVFLESKELWKVSEKAQ